MSWRVRREHAVIGGEPSESDKQPRMMVTELQQ